MSGWDVEQVDVVVAAAMQQEAAPYVEDGAEALEVSVGDAWRVQVAGREVVVVRTGVGLVNSAIVAAQALERFAPRYLISTGSAGGIAEGIFVGDVVVGNSYTYADADATAFGYEPGQVPGMPPAYDGDRDLLRVAATSHLEGIRVRPGKIVSGNTFVDAASVDTVRSRFPAALAADMESTALAQLAYLRGVPFLAVRSISDLCGPTAGEDFSMALDEVAARAATMVRHIVAHLPAA